MQHIKNVFFALMFVAFSVVATEQIYYRFAPITWFVEYTSVTPVGKAYGGEPIDFLSVAFVASGVTLSWNDILKCKSPTESAFKSYSTQPFEKMYDKTIRLEDSNDVWAYQSKVPIAGYVCFLEYGPLVKLPYGITRPYPKSVTETFLIN